MNFAASLTSSERPNTKAALIRSAAKGTDLLPSQARNLDDKKSSSCRSHSTSKASAELSSPSATVVRKSRHRGTTFRSLSKKIRPSGTLFNPHKYQLRTDISANQIL